MTNDFFTIIDDASKENVRLNFSYDEVGGHEGIAGTPVKLSIGGNGRQIGKTVTVSPQQLTELAALFLALAGHVRIDYSSAESLLEGFDLKGKQAAMNLADALVE